MPSPKGRRPNLGSVPPPVDSKHHWRRLMNLVYLAEEDALFRWLRQVRATVEGAERRQRRAA